MLRLARFPEGENFPSSERLHRLFHGRRRRRANEFKRALRRLNKRWFTRLFDFVIALPAFVLELDRLDGDGVGVGIEIGERLKFRNPGAKNLVADGELSRFV